MVNWEKINTFTTINLLPMKFKTLSKRYCAIVVAFISLFCSALSQWSLPASCAACRLTHPPRTRHLLLQTIYLLQLRHSFALMLIGAALLWFLFHTDIGHIAAAKAMTLSIEHIAYTI